MAKFCICNHALLLLAIISIGPLQNVTSLENGLARTPPMGWLAWERYVCEIDCKQYPGECIDHFLFQQMANKMVDDGYKQAGYEYINIDDCWSARKRSETGQQELVADPWRFPDSIGPLADYVHSLGLKLGLYGDCGTQTCQGFPGQLKHQDNATGNYFELDARKFADWKIDSFKFDGCNLNVSQAATLCPPMGTALNKTNRPMLFSCSWPAYENDEKIPTNWELVVEKCNLWRAFGDIEDSWKSVLDTIDWFVKKQGIIVKYHGPGHWFDADQLVIGDFGLSLEQERAQMAIWCIWASPLYMSNDLRTIGKDSAAILLNKWAIAVNQDKLGIYGLMVGESRSVQVFVKPVEPIVSQCPSYAIVYLDRRTLGNGRYIEFKLGDLLNRTHQMLAEANDQWKDWLKCPQTANRTYDVADLFNDGKRFIYNLTSTDNLRLRVVPSGVRMVKLMV
uniref:Alpha-galactosidase n=1 Tax=Aceria tosichella TaxID=561515 RepID=A0A6G1SIZ6_9ACAR